MAIRVFVTGSTGYIGGGALAHILQRKEKLNLDIAVLNRDKNKEDAFIKLGVTPIFGDLDSSKVLIEEASKSDIVVHTADADHPQAARDLIQGLKQRAQNKSLRKPLLIHTSGTGVLRDVVDGKVAGEKFYDDSVYADTHENIAEDALHREIDNIIFEGAKSGEIDTVTVCPPLIYGTSTGPFKKDSQQVPNLIRTAIKYGRAVHVGPGLNRWSNVHVEDLSEFYTLLVEKSVKGEDFPRNDNGYYFVENGTHQFKDLAGEIGKALFKLGAIKDATPEGVSTDRTDVLSARVIGSTGQNSLSKATKARQLGWKPTREPLFDTIYETTDRILNNKD